MTTQAVEERTLETLVGPLAQTFPQLDGATILHSDQLTTERRTAEEPLRTRLRGQLFYTADSNVYTIEEEGGRDEAIWYLGREPTNPIFNNIGEATQQLINTGTYVLPKEKRREIDAVVKAESTLRVNLSRLRLRGSHSEWRYFEIDTANYDSLNEDQRKVAERVYGQGDDFKENMKMLNEDGRRTTRVYVTNPDYVKRKVPQGGALVRASRLYGLVSGSGFDADNWGVGVHLGLRGVRNVAEGDATKILQMYNPQKQ